MLRVWLLVVKCCGPWCRLTLYPLSSNNVDFWIYLWEPTIYTEKIVSCTASEPTPSNKEIRERLIKEDIARCRSAALEHASLCYFNHICQNRSWMALWDVALEQWYHGYISDAGSSSNLLTTRKRLIKEDITRCRSAALEHASLCYFNHICQNRSWMALWNAALEHGTMSTSSSSLLTTYLWRPEMTIATP